jgi:hypothetical protein
MDMYRTCAGCNVVPLCGGRQFADGLRLVLGEIRT